ncbi:MAG: uroporphyrinogen-III synthase [Paracoccaceae bacterium]
MADRPDPRPTLLLTRPGDRGERFSALFRARFGADWPVILSPLGRTRILPLPARLPPFTTLVFTSEAGVEAFAGQRADRSAPAWCVGPRTAEAARDVGFTALEGPGDAPGLAARMAEAGVAGPCLHVRGADVAFPLADTLSRGGIETREVVAYELESLPPTVAARRLLEAPWPVLLPLFSPRSARLAAAALLPARAPLLIAALSEPVARAARTLLPAALAVADRPDADAMLDALAGLSADAA